MTNKERYQQLCQAEPSICVYDQPWWMDAVCGAENWDVLLYEKKGNLLGAMPYYVKSRYGLKYITQPQLTQHNGVWIKYPSDGKYQTRLALEKEVMTALIEQLEEVAAKERIVYYQQSFSPQFANWLPFYWKGYHQTTRYTYRIPPQQNPDCAHEKFSKSVRKNLVKAAALATVSEDGDLQSFYAMQQKTFSRQGLASPYSYAFLEQLDQVLAAHQARKIYLARNQEGILCCASYIVFDDQWVYQLMSGTDPVYRDLQCKTLLVEKALDFAVSTGRGFDFEGSMLQGVEEFNRAFGATQTSYFSIHKTYTKNPLLRAAINQKMQ